MKQSFIRGVVAATLAVGASVGVADTAMAGGKQGHGGRGVPTQQINVQLWTFAEYIGFEPGPAAVQRTEEVFAKLRSYGYRNVEPFSTSGLSAQEYRALLDKYGLKAPGRHVDVGHPAAPQNVDQIIADNKILGVKYFGSGGTPNDDLETEADWVAYAKYLDEVGEKARRAGQTLIVHNHNWEFERVFNGRTAYEILAANTSKKNVAFQLDLYWAVQAGQDPVALLQRYGKRIQFFHVKDRRASDGRIEIVGRGHIDFPRIFAASKGQIRYYTVEHDPRFGDATFNPFEAAEVGFDYLDSVTFAGKRHDRGRGHGHGDRDDRPGRGRGRH
ncbi:sugar phosphate isomerase/epimerase [Solirubrobacter sp. CPCC 204708]|uniref:Sugar phosphate isomerase/epimerase n=1 Tax=Solirubrobacter deserti TaxID=2282478 RepID=A0ABT4RT23_9ACTN|nr:sugar phosphate isomerase/epimerase [Solirubrobacter deserti]MBE2315925.1 sugar phosphate isomerase/epimerase [Solirubrobacter deserti]MDA0141605.1 sugar phosphate isomerase/epimerase [Solirubrobacter deserti]